MHITQEQFDLLIAGALTADQLQAIRAHATSCPVCRTLLAEVESTAHDARMATSAPMSDRALRQIAALGRPVRRAQTIDLLPLTERKPESALWAADGAETSEPNVTTGIMTLASEDPEVVMRILRDSNTGHDHLQLIAEDPSLISHVLVRLPDLDREYLTNAQGSAPIHPRPDQDYHDLTWQIKLPQAVFELEPVKPDSHDSEFSRSIVLESDNGDAVEITLTDHSGGKQIALKVLQLDGRSEFGPLRAIVSQNSGATTKQIADARPALFTIQDFTRPIHIRLFVL